MARAADSGGAVAGEVMDFVPVLYPPENLKDLGQYVSLFVKLDDGGRMFGVFEGDPAAVGIGTRVVGRTDEERKVPFFQIAGQG